MGGCLTHENMSALELSTHEKELIRSTWKLVCVDDNMARYGTNMMVRILIEHKDLKMLWRFARNLETTEDMHSNQLLKEHGEKLFKAFNLVINELDNLANAVPVLNRLGHAHYERRVKETYFQFLGEALISSLQDGLKSQFTNDVRKAYIKLFYIVAFHMKTGLKEAELNNGV